jgi:glycosyltransferase involved in cell wall biosynthesis
MTSGSRRRSVLMTGPSTAAKGGVAAAVDAILGSMNGDPKHPAILYVVASAPRSLSMPRRLAATIRAYAKFALSLWATPRPDVVHVHTVSGRDFWRNAPFLLMARGAGLKVALHVHTPEAMAGFLSRGHLARRVKQLLTDTAAFVIVPSPRGVAPLAELSPVPVRVVPNSVSSRKFESWPVERREKQLVYLGWLTPQKGVLDLIAAFSRVTAADPEARLVLSGPYADDRLRAAIERHRLAAKVVVSDWTAGAAKTRLLASSRALVLPSYGEGFPVVLLEALFSGLPIVATDVGGVADVVEHGVNGFLVRPGDVEALAAHMTELLRDDKLFCRQSDQSLSRARQYDATNAARQLSDLYEEMARA